MIRPTEEVIKQLWDEISHFNQEIVTSDEFDKVVDRMKNVLKDWGMEIVLAGGIIINKTLEGHPLKNLHISLTESYSNLINEIK